MIDRRAFYYISFGAFLFFILAISLGTVLSKKGKAFYHLIYVQALLKEGDVKGAVEQAKEAVKLRPDNIVVVRNLVKAYTEGGMYAEAEEAVEKLIELSPQMPEAYHDLGMIRLSRHDVEGARLAVQKSIAISPELAGNYYLLGAIANEEKDFATAEKNLKKALELDSKNIESSYTLGHVYAQQEKYDEAIEELKKVAEARPDLASVHKSLGWCYLNKKLFIHALAELKTAVELDPSDTDSMYNIACIYSLQNKPEPALNWLGRAIDKGFSDFEHMREDHDLDNIRTDERYIKMATGTVSPTSPGKAETAVPAGGSSVKQVK